MACKQIGASFVTCDGFNRHLCIICQKTTSDILHSKEHGVSKIREAAKIRNDGVADRIDKLKITDTFPYHMTNSCYKNYTHSAKLKQIEATNTVSTSEIEIDLSAEIEAPETSKRQTRSQSTPRAPPNSDIDPVYSMKCVVCGQVSCKRVYEKIRISENDRAQSLLDAAKFMQDEVYTRIADLETTSILIAADIYVHKNCIRNYIRKYDRRLSDNRERGESTKISLKRTLFNRALPSIDLLLHEGKCCTLSELVNFLLGFLQQGEELTSDLRTRDVREFLEVHYGDLINLVPNNRVNESYFLYSSSISANVLAQKIKNQDIMAEAGKMIREELFNVDFGLKDSFCDETDLKTSWEKTMMPDCLLAFFAALFNIPKSKLFKQDINDLNEIISPSDDGQENENDDADIWTQHHKSVQLHCLFQILAYSLHNGRVMTPFHSMVGHFLYSSNRSRNELTTFNRVGVSPSYNTVRRGRSLSESNNVPIPSHFTRSSFTMGAFDNADYSDKSSLAGTDSKHYASMVLFQDASEQPSAKPPVSSTNARSKVASATELPCQVVGPYAKPPVRPSLPANMLLTPENCNIIHLDTEVARNKAAKLEFCIHLVRTGLSQKSVLWTASRVLISKASIPLMRVGFLPVIPKPITNPATVYKALENFENVRKQLDQSVLPVWCDDGVFAPAMEIVLSEPDTFKSIFLMLGPFHWTKVLLRCVGRLFAGSGIDDSLKECEIFGPIVLDSVMNGGHYVRSMTGMLIIEDVIYKLMWEEFWMQKEKRSFSSIDHALKVKEKFEQKMRCPDEFEVLLNDIEEIYQAFLAFKAECESRSEVCRFLGVWLKIASIIKNAVAADREGNWDLLVAVVEDSLPVFAQFDCINYMRHGSWYLEKIKVLEISHPEIYRRFSMGQWAVQDRPGWFCGIGCDMKLEQTIQKVSKGPGGHFVAGQSHKERSVAQFELLFHEIVAITNLFQSVTSKQSDNRAECNLGNSFSPTRNALFNNNVIKLMDFIKNRKNPYNINADVPLHNIVTQQSFPSNVSQNVLNLMQNGEKVYKAFREERFVEKSIKLSSKITKQKQLLLTYQPKTTEILRKKEETTPKDLALAQRHIETAKHRGLTIEQILSYDLLPQSPLFEGDLPAVPNKSLLVTEVEKMVSAFDLSTWQKDSELSTHVVVDFMSKVRQMKMDLFKTLGDLCEHTISSSLKLCPQQLMLHIVFDSYVEQSLKECERIRRTTVSPIDIIGMSPDTLIPQQPEKFWASPLNKQNLQSLVKVVINKYNNSTVLLSSVIIEDELQPAKLHSDGKEEEIQALSNSWLEEADDRLIIHVGWAVEYNRCERIIVVSNDTDTFALLLHHLPYLKNNGLNELWQQFGTGEKRRMIPLHDILQNLGEAFTKVILKAHVLTGDDSMSKVGTKKASLSNGDPVQNLSGFANNEALTVQEMSQAEEYLVRVWSGTRITSAKTFDLLRLEYYTCYSQGIDGLPPTSSVVKSHIRRGAFSLRHKCSIIGAERNFQQNSAADNGWGVVFGVYLPEKNLRFIPDRLIATCNCGSDCTTRRCKCFKEIMDCVIFCHGKRRSPCLNVKK